MDYESLAQSIAYRPQFPSDYQRLGIGIVGFGKVARKWHLSAYNKYGLKITGIYDSSPEVVAQTRKDFPNIHIFNSLDELLEHPEITVVDIATRPRDRLEVMSRTIEARKHILAQKPVALDLPRLHQIMKAAKTANVTIAVNQNGRWAPPWRFATILIQKGIIGDVLAVTHLYDTKMSWIPNPDLQGSIHFLLYDYSIHWIDITRCWLEDKKLIKVQAKDYSLRSQIDDTKITQNLWMSMEYEDGRSALIRGVASAQTHTGHPFVIHGTEGTIRGSVDAQAGDYVELQKGESIYRFDLDGNWFPDGFAGTMGELLSSISNGYEPYNSIEHNLLSIQATLAACESADQDGLPVHIPSIS